MKTIHLMLLSVAMMALVAVGCAGLTAHQKIAVTCESAASALDTLTVAKRAGKITADQLTQAADLYEKAVLPVCHPVAESMSAVQKAELAAALADLEGRAGGVH